LIFKLIFIFRLKLPEGHNRHVGYCAQNVPKKIPRSLSFDLRVISPKGHNGEGQFDCFLYRSWAQNGHDLGTACPSGEIRGNFLGVRNKKSPE
jgi:hypothetical protein